MKLRLLVALCACLFITVATSTNATLVSRLGGQAYYDTVLNITWLTDANLAASNTFGTAGIDANGLMFSNTAGDWIRGMNTASHLGFNNWRLPTVRAVDGSNIFNFIYSNNGSTDWGYGATDIGWQSPDGTFVSELGYMYYTNQGNLGRCTPEDGFPSGCIIQPNYGPINSSHFTTLQPFGYLAEPKNNLFPDLYSFNFGDGSQSAAGAATKYFVWPVRDGDVPPGFILKSDVVIDFGAIGLWSRLNDSSWKKLHNNSPEQVVVGDMDGNGVDDVIAVFGSGIFVKRNLGSWSQLHNFTPELMAIGDLDNNGKEDVVIDFGGIGLWARMNDSSWLKLNNESPTQIAVGDMDGNGADDVIAVFTSGIFVKRNMGPWIQLHNFIPEAMAVGNLDSNGKDDIVIDFGSIGLWARMNDSNWLKLHNTSPDIIATGDIDGNGADDVLATFGSSFGGLWQKINLGGWDQLSTNAPDDVITADIDGSGLADIIANFGTSLGGIFTKRNQTAWAKLHNTSPDSLSAGNLDSN